MPTTEDTSPALVNLLVVLGDNKYHLGRRLAEWSVGAPALESSVACAAIAQEELGHTRAIYSLLEQDESAEVSVLERDDDRARKYCVGFLAEPLPTWYDAVAALTLMDSALTTLIEALAASSNDAVARRAARILGDEEIHRKYAEGRVRELARAPAERALLEERLATFLPEALCWFGPPGEAGVEELRAAGVLARGNEELRQAFLRRLGPLLEEAGVSAPFRRGGTGAWEYEELPWSRWNSLQRRLEIPAAARA